MPKNLKIVNIILGISIFILSISGVVLAEETKAWELINWNGPKLMVERLTSDEYILPDGWQEATKGVKEFAFYNSGGLSGDIATAMNINLFEKKTGIKVKAIEVPAAIEHVKTLSTLLAKDGSIPLLLIGGPDRELTTFAREEWLTPLDFLYPEDVQNIYSPAIKSMLNVDGRWFAGFENALGIGIVYYRPSWLKNAGVDVPNNWQDINIAAEKCRTWAKQSLGDSFYGMVFAGIPENFMQSFQGTVYSQGSSIYDGNIPQFTSEAVSNSFKYWADMIKNDIASKEVLQYDWNDRGRVFGMGKAAFGSGIFTSYLMKYQTEYPDIVDDWDVINPPRWSADLPDEYQKGVLTGNSGAINRFAPDNHQAAAILFLDFLRSKEATRNELIVEGNETFLVSQYEDPEIAKKVDWNLADQVAESLGIPRPPHVEELPFAEVRNVLMKYGYAEQFPPGFPQVLSEMTVQFGKAALGEISHEEAIKSLQSFAEQLVTQ
jgi:ABC-type glycerol-3-phosphate transport system substrate-binding protein